MVSVIVPIYNAEKYLDKCIDSIVKQTFSDIEIVLVDDGSTDNSYLICKKYEALDNRIILFHKENEGLVSARKKGVDIAHGEFICWVDADDWVERDFIKDFVEKQSRFNADVVATSLFHDIGGKSTIDNNGISDGIYSLDDIIEKMLYTGTFYEYGICPHLVTKMFRAEIIRKAENRIDNRINNGEDAAATYVALLDCKTIVVMNKANYHYVQNQDSMTKKVSYKEIDRINILINYLYEMCKEKNRLDIMKPQISMYEKYLKILRKIDFFDYDTEMILTPYGGITSDSNVVIYGAGVVGQRMHEYLSKKHKISIVDWVDQNYFYYLQKGLSVNSPDNLINCKGKYDYVLIANISNNVYQKIYSYLIEKGVESEKIRWFTDAFLER